MEYCVGHRTHGSRFARHSLGNSSLPNFLRMMVSWTHPEIIIKPLLLAFQFHVPGNHGNRIPAFRRVPISGVQSRHDQGDAVTFTE